MSNKSKLQVIEEILEAAQLDPDGSCHECGRRDDSDDGYECMCFAGFVRSMMVNHVDEAFFPSDEVCMQMYADHFGLDFLGEQYFNDLMDFTANWVNDRVAPTDDYQPETKIDPKLN